SMTSAPAHRQRAASTLRFTWRRSGPSNRRRRALGRRSCPARAPPNGIGGRERAWLVLATPDRFARNRSRTARHAALRSHLGPPAPSTRARAPGASQRISSRQFGISVGRAARSLTESGDRRGRGWRGRGGDLDAIRGRRVVPCATDSSEPRSGVANASQARSRPLIAAGGPTPPTPPTGPAPESVPAPL